MPDPASRPMSSPFKPSGSPRLHEVDYRRSGYLGGLPVRLADGGEWAFAGPEEVEAAEPGFRAELFGLLTAIAEEEDEAEWLRGELALGIHLLAVNYEFSPA